MANFYYYDRTGQKFGPVNDVQLKTLAARGAIDPQTPLETESGYKGLAGQIPGLNFNQTASAPPFRNGQTVFEGAAMKSGEFTRNVKAEGTRWLLDFSFTNIRLPIINLWVCRFVYALCCLFALIVFVVCTLVSLYAFLHLMGGARDPDIIFVIIVNPIFGWIIAPFSVIMVRLACEWEIMIFDWIVETTKAARAFVEANKTKEG